MPKRKQDGDGGTPLQQITKQARMRIVKLAFIHGCITSRQASKIARVNQAYYHLMKLSDEGLLRHVGYNQWAITTKAVNLLRTGA